jgi:deoxyribonuclease-4
VTQTTRKIGGHVSSAGGVSKSLDRIAAAGGNCLQIFAGSPRSWARQLWPKTETDKFVIRATAEDLYPLFIHALYLVNLGSDNPDLVAKSISSLIFDMENGLACQASGVIVHLGSYQTRSFAEVKDQLVEKINYILSQTESTPFVIENSAGQRGKIGTLEEIKVLFEEVANPRLRLCLDSAHLFEAGFDLRQQTEVEALVKKLSDYRLLSEVVCLHLNDSKTKLDSRHDQHANLGEGEIGLGGLTNLVNHPQLVHLPLIMEVPGTDRAGTDKAVIDTARSISVSV